MPPLNRKLFFRLLGLLVSVGCLGYFAVAATASLKASSEHLDLQNALLVVLRALPPYAVGYFAFAGIWHLLLVAMGVRAHFKDTAGIFFTSQFGKYLPGNVAHHAGRLYLTHRNGYATASVTASMFLEITITVGAAFLLSLPLVSLLTVRLPVFSTRVLTAGLAILAVGVCTALVLTRSSRFPGIRNRFFSELSLSRFPQLAAALGASFVLAMAAIGLCAISLAMLGDAHVPGDTHWGNLIPKLPNVIALFSVAWIAGLLTPGAPAGLGIREIVLMKGLTASFGATDAVTATILFRLLTVTADIIALGVGIALLRSSRSSETSTP